MNAGAGSPADRIGLEEMKRKITGLLEAIGSLTLRELESAQPAGAAVVKELPSWVARFGTLEAAGCLWLWCEPRPGAQSAFPSQVVLDLPGGRYILDTFAAAASRWMARESAAGGPVVAGLCFTAGPVLVRVRTTGDDRLFFAQR